MRSRLGNQQGAGDNGGPGMKSEDRKGERERGWRERKVEGLGKRR